jgi:enoyl-CoA hydratase/carnithine racemase
MGLGLGVAFECDLVVADLNTRFQITETPRGLGGARFWSLLHTCGAGAFATEVALTGRFFSAEEAHRAGIVCAVAPDGCVIEHAEALAQRITANPPLSVQSTVRVRRWFMDQAERMAVAFTDPMKLYLTDDFREAVAAHVEKREPSDFKGR